MQVIARHIECLCILRSPEPDQSPRNVMKLKLGLNRHRLDQRHPFLSPAHRSRVHVIKLPVHSKGKENIVRIPKSVEPGSVVTHIGTLVHRHRRVRSKPCNHRKWGQNIVAAFTHRTVRAHLKELAIDNHHFASRFSNVPKPKSPCSRKVPTRTAPW